MQHDATSLIQHLIEEQLARKQYPDNFPPLPEVPVARYFDPEFAKIEKQHMWKKTWLFAGLESEVPQIGSYFLFNQLDELVIVIRGKDNELRAMHNICRHRGAQLLKEPRGNTKRFVCPYHAWSYALDGQLLAVRDEHDFACLNKSDHSLKPIRCETWRGMIFINLDPAARPLKDAMAPLMRDTADFPLEGLVIKDRYTQELDCNWKIAYHNFIEGYHLATVHSKTLAPYVDAANFVITLLDNGHSRIAVRKKKGDSIFATNSAPLDKISMDERFTQYNITMPTFPNMVYSLDPSGFTFMNFWPVAPNKTVLEMRTVGWGAGTSEFSDSERDYWVSMRSWTDTVMGEDLELIAGTQRSMQTGNVPAIVMGYQERAIYWMEENIDRCIGPENIPVGMRVSPVLADQTELQ